MQPSTQAAPNESNPLISIAVVIFVPLVAFTPYLMMATAYKTLNPEAWLQKDASLTLLTATIFTIFSITYYLVREKNISPDEYIERIINLREYETKKYIDYILAHYGNVGSVAVIIATITLFTKEAVTHIGISIPSILASFGLSAIFLVYGLAYLKAAFGALPRGKIAYFSLLAMLIVDVTAIKMAIQSIPK